ncbi:MAG: MBL fold metallo-hydrolase [Oscillospiraceae bacterium]|nr:MBL fold metallo-hydrolase [Oscillospiraceae bacterium]
MHIKTLEVGYLQTNCYIVSAEGESLCAVVDPGGDSALIMDYLEEHGLRCGAILLTHGHFDHCGGVEGLLAEMDEEAPVYICRRDVNVEADPAGQFFPFRPTARTVYTDEGDEIRVGSLVFTALACPGHTPGGLSFRVSDSLFTGDSLFKLSAGRTDFPGGSTRALRLTLERLRDMEGNYDVYPGHMDATTLEYERRFNPFLQDLSQL